MKFKNYDEYFRALQKIDKLWSRTERDTQKQLDKLIDACEEYENRKHSSRPYGLPRVPNNYYRDSDVYRIKP